MARSRPRLAGAATGRDPSPPAGRAPAAGDVTAQQKAAATVDGQGSKTAHAFVALNCAALPEALVESQLFGHKRGAFAGATAAQPGLVVAEVGELPISVQAKLLRVLQECTVIAVGEVREQQVDLRVVAAGHRDLCRSSPRADSGRTCTTGSPASSSRCRPCVSGAATWW